ncbi:MAG: hypothetical protein ACKO96_19950, partial [Flammeovirgaceae bacterium]
QIRINKSTEIERIINFLQTQFVLLDDAELVKLALSELYNQRKPQIPLDNPNHPYYNILTPEETTGVQKSKQDIANKKTISLKSKQDIAKFIDKLED